MTLGKYISSASVVCWLAGCVLGSSHVDNRQHKQNPAAILPNGAMSIGFTTSEPNGLVASPVRVDATSEGSLRAAYHFVAITPDGTWTEPCGEYTSDTSCTFTPDLEGLWRLRVAARDDDDETRHYEAVSDERMFYVSADNTSAPDDALTIDDAADDNSSDAAAPATIVQPRLRAAARVKTVSLSASPNPRAGNKVTIYATSTGSSAPRYRYWTVSPAGKRTDICKGYTAATSCGFTPNQSGAWQIAVTARDATATARYQATTGDKPLSVGASCPPEPTVIDGRGEPRNAAGWIRYCWPGEASCFCDADNDCYATDGYLGCAAPAPAPSFSLALAPSAVTLRPGERVSAQALVTRLGGNDNTITISNAGSAGLSADPASIASTSTSVELSITAAAGATPGTQALVFTANDGVRQQTGAVSVTVQAASVPDFSITVSPSFASIQQGGAVASVTVSASRVNGFADPIALAIIGVPAGVSASSATLSGATASAAITLSATSTAAVGQTTLSVRATAGALVKTIPLSLQVSAVSPPSTTPSPQGLVAFPGAEGFGARATGGRGGSVCYVTNLSADGGTPHSLQWCLNQSGARYVLFKVSGVIDGGVEMNRGDVTIAGQTSPGGITVRGLYVQGNEVCEADGCPLPTQYPRNYIIRHLRSRLPVDADTLRVHRSYNGIVDHCSFGNANDESVQISFTHDFTIQNSIFAETIGEHAVYGGMLLNYSDPNRGFELTRLSIHHNNWNRLVGRMPEVSRENPSANHTTMDIEVSNNLLWDPGAPMYTATSLGQAGEGQVYFRFNWVGNYAVARAVGTPAVEPGIPPFTYGMVSQELVEDVGTPTRIFFSGNRINQFASRTDYQLAYCCNDYPSMTTPPYASTKPANALNARHDFPPITYNSALDLPAYMVANAGAFPRDPMDTRLLAAVASGTVNSARRDQNPANDALKTAFTTAPAAPTDSDEDGMPDAWETANGLNPNSATDNNLTTLSLAKTGVEGYTNLEVYLNELASKIVANR